MTSPVRIWPNQDWGENSLRANVRRSFEHSHGVLEAPEELSAGRALAPLISTSCTILRSFEER